MEPGSYNQQVKTEEFKTLRARRRLLNIWALVGAILIIGVIVYLMNILSLPVAIILWTVVIVFCLRGIVNSLEARGISRLWGTTIAYVIMFAVLALVCLLMFSPAFRVVSDLSHIDEMTRDVAQLSQQLPAEAVALMGDAFEQSIGKVSAMLDLAVQSFLEDDEAKAKEVSAADDEVDALYETSQALVVQLIRSTSDAATHMPELLMVAKYFERMGDDAEHIADWAIFRVTGERPERSRDQK